MRIAIASGKGGTGKTTIAASLALSMAGQKEQAEQREQASSAPFAPLFLDCDVEAPNAHLFLKPEFSQRQEVGVLIPVVDQARCNHCGKCAEVCQFHALAVVGKKTLVFPQLCHGCGSCTLMCPTGAISETLEVLGVLERGRTPSGVDFARGILNVGQPMAVPVIRQLQQWASPQPEQLIIVDASPGTSCPIVEAVRSADFLLLVTEPTPFGLHDLKLAVELARELQIPTGVIVNRAQNNHSYSSFLETFCQEQKLPVLLRIPYERAIAEGIAQGKTLIEIHPEYRAVFNALVAEISQIVKKEGQPAC